jgi:hypothetical protein
MKKSAYLALCLILIPTVVFATVLIRRGGSSLMDDANCVGVYYFENDATDESANSNDLTAQGSPTYETSSPSPQQGTYSTLLVAASSQYFESSDADFDVTGSFSVGGWFYFNTLPSYSIPTSKHYASSGSYGWAITAASTGSLEFGISSNGTAWDADTTSTGVVTTSTWYHLVFVYDGTYKRIYIDGSEYTISWPQAYSSGVNVSSANFSYGSRVSSGGSRDRFMDGNIDEAFFFDRALSASEISDIYNNGF